MKHSGEFSQKLVELALLIPPGRVTTYGILAVAAGGHPILARMVTSILAKSLKVSEIPFHRIVYSDGKVWNNNKYDNIRKALYRDEGIKIDKNNRIINFEKIVFDFTNE